MGDDRFRPLEDHNRAGQLCRNLCLFDFRALNIGEGVRELPLMRGQNKILAKRSGQFIKGIGIQNGRDFAFVIRLDRQPAGAVEPRRNALFPEIAVIDKDMRRKAGAINIPRALGRKNTNQPGPDARTAFSRQPCRPGQLRRTENLHQPAVVFMPVRPLARERPAPQIGIVCLDCIRHEIWSR